MENYLLFNTSINDIFFDGRHQARPIYLDLEDDVRDEISKKAHLNSEDFDSSVGLCVSHTLRWESKNIYSWHFENLKKWQSAKFEGAPPFSALLIAFSLAAENMRHGDDFSSNNYYQRLCEVFGVTQESKKLQLRNSGKDTLIFWKALNHWLTKNDYQFGKPTAKKVNSFPYVSYPISQSLIREADRKTLHKMFVQFGLSSHENLTESEIKQYLHQWMTTSAPSTWLKKLWGMPDLRERVVSSASSELDDWEETYKSNKTGLISLKFNWSMVVTSFPKSQIKLCLVTAIDQKFDGAELKFSKSKDISLVIQAFNNIERLWLTEYSGTSFAFLDSSEDINLNALLLAPFELETIDASKSYRCEPRGVIPFLRMEGAPLFREVKKVSLYSKHNILCHVKWRPRVEQLLIKSARSGYSIQDNNVLHGLPAEWVLFRDVEIVSIQEDVTNDLQDLVPLTEGLNMHIQGGLKLASGIWHTMAPPEIFVSDDQGLLDVAIKNNELVTEGQEIFTKTLSTKYDPNFLKSKALSLDSKNLVLVAGRNGKSVYEKDISFRSASTPRKLQLTKEEILFYPVETNTKLNLFGASPYNESQKEPCYLQGMSMVGELPTQHNSIDYDLSKYSEARFESLGNWEKDYILDQPSESSTSCIVNGYHHWDVTFDSKSMTCKHCDLFQLCRSKKTRKKATKILQSTQPRFVNTVQLLDLEGGENVKVSLDIAYDAICYLGAGNWTQLQSILSETVELPWHVHGANQNLIDLGLLDQTVDKNGFRPVYWSCPPPVFIVTRNANGYLSGFRNNELIKNVKLALDGHGFAYESFTQTDNQTPTLYFWKLKSIELTKIKGILSNIKDCHGRSLMVQYAPDFVKQRAILSRLGVETASNSFHLSVSLFSVLAGEIWSDLYGHDLRNTQALFSTKANRHRHCQRHGHFPPHGTQTHQYG